MSVAPVTLSLFVVGDFLVVRGKAFVFQSPNDVLALFLATQTETLLREVVVPFGCMPLE
jgi:hypothetical protein